MDKAVLRTQFRSLRAELSDDEYAHNCRQIVTRLGALPELRQSAVIHVYWPHFREREREIDLRPLISFLRALDKTVVLPVVNHESQTPRLFHGLFTSERELKPNRWGILEPQGNHLESADVIDAVIVPALGVDQCGYRIGYGKGYYDALLSTIDAVSVCPAFSATKVERLPAESHDVPVDLTVTEHETFHHKT